MDSQYESPRVLYLLLTAVFSVFQQVPQQRPWDSPRQDGEVP